MFIDLQSGDSRSGLLTRFLCIAAHGGVLLFLLHAPTPVVLMPTSLKAGDSNGLVAELYWPKMGSRATEGSEAATSHLMSQNAALNWRPPHKADRHEHGQSISTSETKPADTTAKAGSLPPIGSPFGSQANGLYSGADVRPALPVNAFEPRVDSSELQGVPEGDVVVEITIDEKGNIVEKKIVRSLAPNLDLKVLAALEAWHFEPATRNGLAIASKQDIYYHFRPE